MELYTLIGTAAAICGAISLIPEVLKAYRTHHLNDVSWGMLFLLTSSSVLWGLYGMLTNDILLTASSIVNFVMEGALIIMKQHFHMTGKPLKEHFEPDPKPEPAPEQQLQPVLETEESEIT